MDFLVHGYVLGAALCEDIDLFLANILAKFKLTKWVTGDLDTETSGTDTDPGYTVPVYR